MVEAENIYQIVIKNGDRADEIAKKAQEMFDSYWKSEAFAKDCHAMMKEIKGKLL